MKEIFFRVRITATEEIFGYERLTEAGWESNCPALDPEGKERWTNGVFIHEGLSRELYIGQKDKHGNKIFDGDEIIYHWSRGKTRRKTGEVSTKIIFKYNFFCPEINETVCNDWAFPYKICELTGNNIHDKTPKP